MQRYRYHQKKKRKQASGTSRFKRGFYQPINESKYRQPVDRHMNAGQLPEYRSSWELAFYKYCDQSDKIEYWGTEPFSILYISPKDGKPHRYYIDVVIYTKEHQKFLIEIKPKKQCNNPINLAKWEAARKYCAQIGAQFLVVTEVELKSWGLIN